MDEQDGRGQEFDEIAAPRRSSVFAWFTRIGCSLLTILVLAAILFPVFAPAREGRRWSCLSNLKLVGSALAMYTQDYDGQLPPAAGWQAGIDPYHKRPDRIVCPSRPGVVPAFAYNLSLDRLKLTDSMNPAQMPAFFDSSLGVPDAADRLESFVQPHTSSGVKRGNIAFADGHVKAMAVAPSASAGLDSQSPSKVKAGGKR